MSCFHTHDGELDISPSRQTGHPDTGPDRQWSSFWEGRDVRFVHRSEVLLVFGKEDLHRDHYSSQLRHLIGI